MGSIVKRGGHLHIIYDLPRGADGKRRQRMQSCRGMSPKEAALRLKEIELGIAHGTYIDPTTATVAEYLERWMSHCEQRLAASTINGYQGCIDRYILPEIGHVRLKKLSGMHLEPFLDNLGKSKDKGGRGLSPKTVYNVHGVLRKALKRAVQQQMLERDPMTSVEPPKLRLREMASATDEELGALLTLIAKSAYRMPTLLSMGTGLRRGEVLGLKWEDFDQEKAELRVCRSMAQVPRRQPFAKEPKSGKQRTVGLTPYLVAELVDHRKAQMLAKLAKGQGYAPDEGWICTQPNGVHITPNALTKMFIRLRDRAGAKISFHGLRHTVATELLAAGLPIGAVSELLGHAKPSTTLNIYGHVIPRTRAQVISVIDQMMKRVEKPQTGSG